MQSEVRCYSCLSYGLEATLCMSLVHAKRSVKRINEGLLTDGFE